MKPRDQFGLDALLGRWPAQDPQAKGGPSWDERADAIVKVALARRADGAAGDVEALLAAPALEPEPGEEKAASYQFDDGASEHPRAQSDAGAVGRDEMVVRPRSQATGGEAQTMSNDQSSQPKRPSLKDLAARASQAGAGRASVTPPPGSVHPPARASMPPALATVTPIAKAKSARPSDPGREDSGVLRLADLQANEAAKAEAAATAAEAALASAAAKRAEDRKEAAAVVTAKPAATAAGGKSSAGLWAGVAIGVIGIAAAFAVYKTRQPETVPTKTATVTETKPESAKAPAEAPKAAATAEVAAATSAEAAPAATEAPKADDAKGAAGTAAPSATAVASNEPAKAAQPAGSALVGSKVGSLAEEIQKAGGGGDLPTAPQDDGSKPASGAASGNIPEQPSQGNAQAAIRAVMGGAKACVAGAPEPTSANVTFSSSGSVQSVSVSGWAAANGKAACVKGALQGAHVSPFAKPTFTVPVTVRP